MRKLLSSDEINKKMKNLNDWSLQENKINKNWNFTSFNEAIRFINKVASLAEKYDHHPEIFNVYSKVKLKFYTHDAGGLTELDFKIAAEIDRLA